MSRTSSLHGELAKFKGRTGNGEDLTLEALHTWPAQDPDRAHLGFRLLHPRILWHEQLPPFSFLGFHGFKSKVRLRAHEDTMLALSFVES